MTPAPTQFKPGNGLAGTISRRWRKIDTARVFLPKRQVKWRKPTCRSLPFLYVTTPLKPLRQATRTSLEERGNGVEMSIIYAGSISVIILALLGIWATTEEIIAELQDRYH
jgi:hypothetical protein